MLVPSRNAIPASTPPRRCAASSSRFQAPRRDQRPKVCAAIHHGPGSAGIWRHFAPLSWRQMIASTVRRRSWWSVLYGGRHASIRGASTFHCASVRTPSRPAGRRLPDSPCIARLASSRMASMSHASSPRSAYFVATAAIISHEPTKPPVPGQRAGAVDGEGGAARRPGLAEGGVVRAPLRGLRDQAARLPGGRLSVEQDRRRLDRRERELGDFRRSCILSRQEESCLVTSIKRVPPPVCRAGPPAVLRAGGAHPRSGRPRCRPSAR